MNNLKDEEETLSDDVEKLKNPEYAARYAREKYLYSKNGEKHIINNLYKDEVSVLTVKNSYLLITTNQNNTSFFQILDQYASDFFICDFSNMDYFWLSSLKMLATSNAV